MRILLFLILIISQSRVSAQKKGMDRIDSLKRAIQNIPAGEKRQKAIALHDLATMYMHISNYVQAASHYAESLKLAIQMNDELLMALIYRNMGVVSFNQMNYEKTSQYHHKALAIYQKRNDNIRKAELLKLMADNMLTKGDAANARRYYDEAIAIFKKTGNRLGEAMAYSNLSLVFNTRYTEKIRFAMDAKKIFDSLTTDNPIPATNLGNLGVAYFDIVRYNHMHLAPPGPLIPGTKQELLALAEKYIRDAISLATSKGDIENSAYFSGLLAELQEYNGDFRNAYYNIRKYFETNDSIFSQQNKNQIAALQNKQEIDLKNTEIEMRKFQLRNQRTQLLLLAGGSALLLIIGVLLYRQGLIRKRNNKALQELNNTLRELNKELASANQVKAKFFAILSHDLRSPIARLVSFLQFQKLKPGMLAENQVADREQKIEEAAQTLLGTMETMLLWSKEQMENFQPVKTDVRIDSLFEYVKNNFAGIDQVHLSFSGSDGLLIHTDENYLRTIIHNLTSNAIKAVQAVPTPNIEWNAWEESGIISLSITDNGPGISADRAAIFFEGMNNTDSRHGLGLQIIRDLAKAIDCKLRLAPVEKGMKVLLQFNSSTGN